MTNHHGHHDDHGHHDPQDWAVRGAELVAEAQLRAPMVDQALAWLVQRAPQALAVIDVGSGPGVAACSLAAMLPQAQVTAVDGAEPLLAAARERAEKAGVAQRFTTRQLSLPDGLAQLEPADLVWVSEVVHHLPDPVGALRAIGALLKPGGLLAVREGGLPMRCLPDGVAPGLLPRLEAIGEELIAAGEHPGGIVAHQGGWPDLLRAAGLEPAGSRSFLLDLQAPLPESARRHVHGRLARWLDFAGDRMTAPDRATLDRLLDADSPDGVLRRPDLFLLTATTVHTAWPAGLSFRSATLSDVDEVAALVESAYRGDASRAGWTTEADILLGQRTDAQTVTEIIADPRSVLLLAETGGELVACCHLENRADYAYFGMFAVRPARQTGGIGKRVVAEAETFVRQQWGIGEMRLTVIIQREELISWYQRRGYLRTGKTSPFPYGDERFGLPQRDDLEFELLVKDLLTP